MPYGKEFETMIGLLEKVVIRLDILTGITIALVAIGFTIIIVKFALKLITKKLPEKVSSTR
jgi:hypothetical protein